MEHKLIIINFPCANHNDCQKKTKKKAAQAVKTGKQTLVDFHFFKLKTILRFLDFSLPKFKNNFFCSLN